MPFWRQLTSGMRGLVNEAAHARDVQDEVQHFLDEATRSNIAAGMSPAEARRAAQREVGNPTNVRERVRASLWENTVSTLFTDVRYAARMLRRSPVFTAVVVLVISLGVGAVTTIFSAANAFLFKPLPGATNASRLVGIDRIETAANGGAQASYPYYTFLRERTRTLSGVAAWSKTDLTLTVNGGGHAVYGNLVSGNYFSVLGVRPALGRFFLPEEDVTPLANAVIVVSHEFWRGVLGGDSSAIGRTIRVNGSAFTLVGVTPPGFRGVFTPLVTSAWVPLMMQPLVRPKRSLESASMSWLWMFGRLKDGVSQESARQELLSLTAARIAEAVEPEWMRKNDGIRLIRLTGLPDDARKAMLAFTGVLLAISFLVLLIASVNVAAMLSARAVARQHEMAIRVALGAGRGRLVRQLLTESLVLFALGAAGGLSLALLATRGLERIPLPDSEPMSLDLSPDLRVLSFALLVSLATGVVFGLAPALRAARQDINARLRNDARIGTGRMSIAGSTLIVSQLALSLVLLVSAGLLLRALDSGSKVNPGFDSQGVITAAVKPESWGYDDAKARLFYRSLRERTEAAPGVASASYAAVLPLQMQSSGAMIQLDDNTSRDGTPGRNTHVNISMVDPAYFATIRIPLLAGREFLHTDDATGQSVAIVNETLARKHWPNASAVGRTFMSGTTRITIVGVARDAKYSTLTEATPELVYFPLAQQPLDAQTLIVRTTSPAATRNALVDVVRSMDPSIPRIAVVSLEQATSFALLPQQVAALVTGALGALGLLLASTGLYGTISYSVSRRSREIGVRMALGARSADVERMVVRSGMKLAGIGVVVGLLLAVGASRLLVSFLYGVSPLDLPTFVATSAVFVAVAFVASYLPARRAASADPLVALRSS